MMTRKRAERIAWIVGGLALLLTLLGWMLEPGAFAYAWLAAITGWIGWPLGCLALLFTHALTGGRWGQTIRPYLLAGIVTLPLALPAVVPLLFVLPHLYPWLRPGIVGTLDNAFYLNPLFAAGRGVLYLMVWFGLAALVLRSMRHGGPPAALAVVGLILLGWTTTFAAVDATMSLDPRFVSSNYGMIAAAEAGLLALSICVLAAALDTQFPPDALDDIGRLLLGLLVLWAYLDFMQFLIVWQSDLPRDAAWYIARSSKGWGVLAAIVALGHFILPFFALMSPRLRATRRGIGAVAVLLIAMEGLRAWWLVLPADNRSIGLLDVMAMLAVAGLSAGVALHGPRQRPALLRTRHG